MRKIIYGALSFTIIAMSIFSCQESSVTEDFEEANGSVEAKLITNFNIESSQGSQDNHNITLTYTTDGKLNTISNGIGTSIFVYDNTGSLEDITTSGNGSGINLERDVYQSPLEFSDGNVLTYDSDGNPKTILFYKEEYDTTTWTYVNREYTATVMYDDAPNPFFYTLEAGGIIEAMELSQINFSASPQSSGIVQARMLLPFNNPSQVVFRDEDGEVAYTINSSYTYDSDNYPTSATITSVGESETSVYTINYTYLDN